MKFGKLLGRGRTAEVFALAEGRALKLFLPHVKCETVKREYRIAHLVMALGLPAPRVYELSEVSGRQGIVYEKLSGPTLTRWAIAYPPRLGQAGDIMAELHSAIHNALLPPDAPLALQSSELERDIRGAPLPVEVMEACLDAARELAQGDRLCHGDFHPDNIIMSRRGPVVIDWLTAVKGNPLVDVARSALILRAAALPPHLPITPLIHLARRSLHDRYLSKYCAGNRADPASIEACLVPVAAGRLREGIAGETLYLQELIRKNIMAADV